MISAEHVFNHEEVDDFTKDFTASPEQDYITLFICPKGQGIKYQIEWRFSFFWRIWFFPGFLVFWFFGFFRFFVKEGSFFVKEGSFFLVFLDFL